MIHTMTAGVEWKDLEMKELDDLVMRREFVERRRQREERSMANKNQRARARGKE
jgi:hypothetical protein